VAVPPLELASTLSQLSHLVIHSVPCLLGVFGIYACTDDATLINTYPEYAARCGSFRKLVSWHDVLDFVIPYQDNR
jgi:hypothetical protein